MDQYRRLAVPAYIVACMLMFIPLFDATMQLWPLRPDSTQWRFGALGLMSNAFLIPAVGLLIVLVTGRTFGHVRLLRVTGWLCAAAAVVATILLLLFALDAVETRTAVTAAGRLSFVVASFTAAGKMLLAIVTLVLMARAGLRTHRARSNRGAPERGSVLPLGERATSGVESQA
jgi:hypothetical protein